MTADIIAVALMTAAAPAVNFFVLYYGATSPWWRSAAGRSVMTSTVGLALLIDISLAYNFLGDDYPFRDLVRNSVYGLIMCGAWLQVWALATERRRNHEPDA